MSKNKAVLYAKMARVMGRVTRVKESGKHQQGWRYATSEDVKDVVRVAMAEEGLALFYNLDQFDEIEQDKGYRVRGCIEFTIACGETGETVTSKVWGEAVDYGDKALNKLYTTTEKYFLKTTFLISSGDEVDSDADDSPPPPPRPQRNQRTVKTNGNGQTVTTADLRDAFFAQMKEAYGLDDTSVKAILKAEKVTAFKPSEIGDYKSKIKAQMSQPTTEAALVAIVTRRTGNYYDGNIHHIKNAIKKGIDMDWPPQTVDDWQAATDAAIDYAAASNEPEQSNWFDEQETEEAARSGAHDTHD